MSECGTCGFPRYRAEAHAAWCWTNDPNQPDRGGDSDSDAVPSSPAFRGGTTPQPEVHRPAAPTGRTSRPLCWRPSGSDLQKEAQ